MGVTNLVQVLDELNKYLQRKGVHHIEFKSLFDVNFVTASGITISVNITPKNIEIKVNNKHALDINEYMYMALLHFTIETFNADKIVEEIVDELDITNTEDEDSLFAIAYAANIYVTILKRLYHETKKAVPIDLYAETIEQIFNDHQSTKKIYNVATALYNLHKTVRFIVGVGVGIGYLHTIAFIPSNIYEWAVLIGIGILSTF